MLLAENNNQATAWGMATVLFTCAVALVLFIFQPFLAVLLVAMLGMLSAPDRFWAPLLLCLLGSAFIGLINTTKLPESDLIRYFEWYDRAQTMGLLQYLSSFTREPVFYIWNWFVSRLSGGDQQVFVFLTTALIYWLLTYSIVLVGRYLRVDSRLTLVIVLLFLFLPPLFSISGHLVRQVMAAAFIALFFARRIALGKASWWLALLAGFVHFSALIFIPLALLRMPQRCSPIIYFVCSAVALGAFYLVVKVSAELLSQFPVFNVLFLRIAALRIPDVVGLSTNAILVLGLVLAVIAVNIWSRNPPEAAGRQGFYLDNFSNSVLLLSVVILLSSLSTYTLEVAMRLFLYLYFLAGPVLLIFLRKNAWTMPIVMFLTVCNLGFFFYTVEFGVWDFMPVWQLSIYPAPLIWGGI